MSAPDNIQSMALSWSGKNLRMDKDGYNGRQFCIWYVRF